MDLKRDELFLGLNSREIREDEANQVKEELEEPSKMMMISARNEDENDKADDDDIDVAASLYVDCQDSPESPQVSAYDGEESFVIDSAENGGGGEEEETTSSFVEPTPVSLAVISSPPEYAEDICLDDTLSDTMSEGETDDASAGKRIKVKRSDRYEQSIESWTAATLSKQAPMSSEEKASEDGNLALVSGINC